VRDNVHVEDLASAHIDALDYLRRGGSTAVCNRGSSAIRGDGSVTPRRSITRRSGLE
jgi:UDP-glucose 4-epimerase